MPMKVESTDDERLPNRAARRAARSGRDHPRERRALSPRELAEELGLSESTILRACRAGKIQFIRIGRRILIPANESDRLLAQAGAA